MTTFSNNVLGNDIKSKMRILNLIRNIYLNQKPGLSPTVKYFTDHSKAFVDLLCFCSVLCLLCLCARLFICALWSPAGKGLTSWLSFVVSTVSLSLSHWYPGSGVVLDCTDSC